MFFEQLLYWSTCNHLAQNTPPELYVQNWNLGRCIFFSKIVTIGTSFLLQWSPPIRDSQGTKTFVYYRRNLLQEGWLVKKYRWRELILISGRSLNHLCMLMLTQFNVLQKLLILFGLLSEVWLWIGILWIQHRRCRSPMEFTCKWRTPLNMLWSPESWCWMSRVGWFLCAWH